MTALHWAAAVFGVVYLVAWTVFVLTESDRRVRPPLSRFTMNEDRQKIAEAGEDHP